MGRGGLGGRVQEALLNLAASLISVWQPVNGVDFDEDEDWDYRM